MNAREKSIVRAYLGLGSNTGDRVGFVQQAMQLLKDIPGLNVIECSSLYETEPPDNNNSQWFVNAVAEIETKLSCLDLLDICKDIEARLIELDRQSNTFKKVNTGGRIIDLDILFFGDQVLDHDHLKVPHPSLHKRAFALVPLLEIAPDLVHPQMGCTVSELHEALPEPEMVYLYGTRSVESS